MTGEIIELPHPLSRFYIKRGPTKWEAWAHGWKFDHDEQPDWHLGDFATKKEALASIQTREDSEKERFGVWRFFVD